jgi:hypothetical protein
MANYEVAVYEVFKTIIPVEASSGEDALNKANDILADGSDVPSGVYDHTLSQDTWKVWEA